MSLPLRKCPYCKFWWFDRMTYGCSKQENRTTYPTSEQWRVESEKIYCSDFRSLKLFNYLFQKDTKRTDRMIQGGDESEITNEKISKDRRKISVEKKSKKKKEDDVELFIINKPHRLIRT